MVSLTRTSYLIILVLLFSAILASYYFLSIPNTQDPDEPVCHNELKKVDLNSSNMCWVSGEYTFERGTDQDYLYVFPDRTFLYLRSGCFFGPVIFDRGYWYWKGNNLEFASDKTLNPKGRLSYNSYVLYSYEKKGDKPILLLVSGGGFANVRLLQHFGENLLYGSFKKDKEITFVNYKQIKDQQMTLYWQPDFFELIRNP